MTAPPKPEPFQVAAQPGSRLEDLLASREIAKAQAEEAADRLKAVNEAIESEIAAVLPEGTTRVSITGAPGLPSLKMSWMTPWRLDSKRLKEEQPEIYVRYSKQLGFWELRAGK